MSEPDDFEVLVMDDPAYDNLIAEVTCRGTLLMVLSQENLNDAVQVEIHAPSDGSTWRFSLSELKRVLQQAEASLQKLGRHT